MYKRQEEVQDRLGYMPQKFGLYEDLTCMENMNLYADLHGIPEEKRTERFNKPVSYTHLDVYKRQATTCGLPCFFCCSLFPMCAITSPMDR